MRLFAVTIDAPTNQPWPASTPTSPVWRSPTTAPRARSSPVTASLMFQQISDYNPPRWPDPAHPQQAHLDLLVDDLDTGEARALELGARRLSADGERFRVFTDPAGHPFCLIR
jgi:hypothetical protein